ncbi:MAG: nucleotidyl transferase AbiEii/AbiGii toxin family protein [Planctomycetes bacterium]|nr:nucleotidyl transferase AbiEii/AbiGii toxin family protein [Planctomycetota bacterium]
MNVQIIQQRLLSYNCKTEIDEQHAIREITQDVVLAALGRSDFFQHALFHGGTCLRIFYGLNRFSEDMDFILQEPDKEFSFENCINPLKDELSAYGYNADITDRSTAGAAVKKAFLKDELIGKVIEFQYQNQTGPMNKIRIKLEVDTNPPIGSGSELKYVDFPFVSSVAVQDRPSLFAGKLHALLCREYAKGRDWYDFIWYTGRDIDINYTFLTSAIAQMGPWKNQGIQVNETWLVGELEKKILSLNWGQVADDVRRFIPINEQQSLGLWDKELFLQQLAKLRKFV